jgi:hypothetical protein
MRFRLLDFQLPFTRFIEQRKVYGVLENTLARQNHKIIGAVYAITLYALNFHNMDIK